MAEKPWGRTGRERKQLPSSEQLKLPKVERSQLRGENNKLLINKLVLELGFDYEKAIYTLKEEDFEAEGRVFYSLPRIYRLLNDPTEFLLATRYFWDFSHYRRFRSIPKIEEVLDNLKEEVEQKLAFEGFQRIMEMAQTDKGYQAAKFLVDKGWKGSQRASVGRPKKVKEEEEEDMSDIKADLLRLRDV